MCTSRRFLRLIDGFETKVCGSCILRLGLGLNEVAGARETAVRLKRYMAQIRCGARRSSP